MNTFYLGVHFVVKGRECRIYGYTRSSFEHVERPLFYVESIIKTQKDEYLIWFT